MTNEPVKCLNFTDGDKGMESDPRFKQAEGGKEDGWLPLRTVVQHNGLLRLVGGNGNGGKFS